MHVMDKVAIETNRKPYTVYRMVPRSMTFQGRNIFLILNISETTQDRAIHSYCRTSIESYRLSIKW